MFKPWRIGTVFGIGIYVHWTFSLLAAWVLFANWSPGRPEPALLSLALLTSAFGCVVLHELGHALMARRFGIRTRDITLYPIGGVARLERLGERPWEEFWIAVAGPAVNVGIAALLGSLLWAADSLAPTEAIAASFAPSSFLNALFMINTGLALFNLLPAFPMDGGRVLRALLSPWLGRLQATQVAAGLGALLAGGFLIFAVLAGEPFLILLAMFVFFAGRQELAAIRYRKAGSEPETIDMAQIPSGGLDAAPAQPAFSGFTWDGRAHHWIEWRNGRPIHIFSVE
jgi:Zn-dependent protease